MKKQILSLALGTVLILSIPFIVMQFSEDVNWNLFDFLIAGFLLFTAGLAYEMLTSKASTSKQKIASGVIVLAVLIVIWAELAVGLFGSPLAGS